MSFKKGHTPWNTGKKYSNKKFENINGQKFNRLTVIKRIGKTKVKCLCDCGNECIIAFGHLKSGHTKSCGCLAKEEMIGNTHGFIKGQIGWNKGIKIGPLSEEHKMKIGLSNLGKSHSKEVLLKFSGKNHWNWKGGIRRCDPYCKDWTKEYKEYIRERDSNKCQNPDCWGKCNHKTMTVHHIDYNKKNCVPENLITLCGSCNSRANGDREWHQAWYKAIIYKRCLKFQ